jgi:hypothetical protein
MRLGPALAAASLLLAGCSGGGDGEPTDTDDCDLEPVLCDPEHYLANHPCIKKDVRPRVYAPDTPGPDAAADPWAQGDWWTYRLDTGRGAKATTLVYYDDADFAGDVPQHYLVGVPDRADALEHALFSVNPMLGRIHRALYSPHESGLHADMFNFPLCDGAQWSTGFYDRDFQLTARLEEIQIPGGATDPLGFRIEGRASDGSTLSHTYSTQVKWFTELHLARADGVRVDMTLDAYGSGRAGRVEFLRAQRDVVIPLADVPDDGWPIDAEPGAEGPYDRIGAYLEVARAAGTGRIEVHLRDPAGTSRACVGLAGSGPLDQTTCPAGPLRVEVPWQEGTWRLTVETLIVDTQTRAAGEVRVVSLYDRGGTV